MVGLQDKAWEAMQILKRLWAINKRIDDIYERIARCREMATRATSTTNAANISGTGGRSRVEANAIRIMDLEAQLDETIDRLVKERTAIQKAIEQIEDDQAKRILELRYIDRRKWDNVMMRMHISRTHSFRLHEEALLLFAEKYHE